jgi:hypothetical protein
MKTMQEWIKAKTANVLVASIPYEHAGVCWDLERKYDSAAPRNDLHVVDLRLARSADTNERAVWKPAASTAGACTTYWKERRNPRHTPLGMFAEMAFDGTLPKGTDFVNVLTEFAQIEGCDWAVHMLAALHMGYAVSDTDEEFDL